MQAGEIIDFVMKAWGLSLFTIGMWRFGHFINIIKTSGIKSFSKDGFEFFEPSLLVASQQQQSQETSEPPVSLTSNSPATSNASESRIFAPEPQTVTNVDAPLVAKIVETQIRPQLENLEDDEKIIRLERAAATLTLHIEFMKIYMVIFGSQITLLNTINAGPLKVDNVKPLFQQNAEKDAKFYAGYSFENWLGFLTEQSLCEIKEDKIFATEHTKPFLLFITANQLPYKPH